LSPEDPLITLEIVHDYVARRSTESETTRAHRFTLIREVCRFLRLEDARTVVPDRRSLRIVRQRFVPRVLSRDEGNVSCKLAPSWRKDGHRRFGTQFWALPCAFCTWPDCEPESFCDSPRPMSIWT
jgi:hypothetical protein